MNKVLIFTSVVLFAVNLTSAEVGPEPYQRIKIKQISSKLISRDETNRVYSGQIKTVSGLAKFEKTYGIDLDNSKVDFNKQMLIFGITDDIATRAFQFLIQDKVNIYTLDYAESGIKYKLRMPDEGKKHSYIQVFILKKIEGIPHILVKNHIRNGLSKVYDE